MMVPIQKIVQHPEYDYPQNNFDIAYLRTVMDIPLGRTVLRAFIAPPGASEPREIRVTGYGYQGEGQMQLSDKLREVTLPIISNTECQLFYPEKSITKNMICGYSMRDMDKGTCLGDGGDPATVNRRLIGISSYARGCGPGMGPSVFTYVDAPEIREFIMNGTRPAQRPGIPSEQPQRPSEQPQRPSEEPQRPSEDPQRPSEQPQRPSEQPQRPSEQPQRPSEQPQRPSEQPQRPSEQPQRPSEQPQRPSEQPQRPSEQPQRPSEQPQRPSEQPQRPSEQPQRPSEQPQRPSEQPQRPSEQPQRPSEQP
ncbi:zonadhesin-like [Maniola hyperantus]|uniref:zonadhesin-like n=1 Tax=Aphantopus hyperantus TaxID=2795564 RepID=UPI003749D1D5